MSYQYAEWDEREAENTVVELLGRESLPEELKRDVTAHVERNEPVRALELALDARRESR